MTPWHPMMQIPRSLSRREMLRATVFFLSPSSPANHAALRSASSAWCSGARRSCHRAGPWLDAASDLRTSSSRLTLGLFVFTWLLLLLQVDPPVVVGNPTASDLVILAQLERRNVRRWRGWLRCGWTTCHAYRVAGLSSGWRRAFLRTCNARAAEAWEACQASCRWAPQSPWILRCAVRP